MHGSWSHRSLFIDGCTSQRTRLPRVPLCGFLVWAVPQRLRSSDSFVSRMNARGFVASRRVAQARRQARCRRAPRAKSIVSVFSHCVRRGLTDMVHAESVCDRGYRRSDLRVFLLLGLPPERVAPLGLATERIWCASCMKQASYPHKASVSSESLRNPHCSTRRSLLYAGSSVVTSVPDGSSDCHTCSSPVGLRRSLASRR